MTSVHAADRTYGLGKPVRYGASAITKRIDALRSLWPLSGDDLLDVGCGNGSYTAELARGFTRTVGIDIEPVRLASCPIECYEMSAEDMDFEDESFDVVTAIEVIEHIEDLDKALKEIHRVLRPGGALLVTCPNRLFPLETHVLTNGIHGRYFPGLPWFPNLHARYATARTFTPAQLCHRMWLYGLRKHGLTYIFPAYDNSPRARVLRPFTDKLERTPARIFGISIVAAFVR